MNSSRFIAFFLSVFLVGSLISFAGEVQDSTARAQMRSMLERYVTALEPESMEIKIAECDFLIQTASEAGLEGFTANYLYAHYVDSPVMGEEAVAIHLYDRWFSDGTLDMPTEEDKLNARIFASFNRSSLIGMEAPVLNMVSDSGSMVEFPRKRKPDGAQTVIYFYDISCSKCGAEIILLRNIFSDLDIPVDFYAVYVGTDEEAWRRFIAGEMRFSAPSLSLYHVWDPEFGTDYQRKYGVIQTPRLFLVDQSGIITGRRLTPDALLQLLTLGKTRSDLLSRCPVGERLPKLHVSAVLRTAGHSRRGRFSLRSLRGSPAYLVLYTEGCNRCKEELEAVDGVLKKGARVLLVDVDEVFATDESLSKKLFDCFDLTALPHTVELDRNGRVTDKYISFKSLAYGTQKEE